MMTFTRIFLFYFAVAFSTSSVFSQKSSTSFKSFSPAGVWRGVFTVRDSIQVPFNFEIQDRKGAPTVYLLNGVERFEAGPLRLAGDSAFVPLDQFDNELAFHVDNGQLRGFFRKQDLSGTAIPVDAVKSGSRFVIRVDPAVADLSGTYHFLFKSGNKVDSAVAVFKQQGQRLTATVMRITGDFRYLEGSVEGGKFYLSSFIGSNPSFYRGTIAADGKLNGEQVGVKTSTAFTAIPDENAALHDPYSLTYLKKGYSTFDFSLPDSTGRKVSLKDPKFRNKVVVVTIGGTWCPNCMDEAAFLSPWYKQNRDRGVEVVALQYERQSDPAYVKKVLQRFRKKFDIQYEVLFGGLSEKEQVAASLPALNNFISFPTMIFIDRQGRVDKIHTGFSGPATGRFYEQFKDEFNHEVNKLLKQ